VGGIWKENWKRGARQRSVSAVDPFDLLRVEDIALLGLDGGGGSGIYRVTNLSSPSPQVAPGGDEAILDLVVIALAGDYDVVLPSGSLVGKRYEIKDGFGDGCAGGVTKQILTAGNDTIEGTFTSFPLNNCFQSWSLIYAGSNIWRLV